MRKITLLAITALISISAMAQNSRYKADPIHRVFGEKQTIGIEPVKDASIVKSDIKAKPIIPAPDRDVNIVNIVDIGTSANVWSYVSNNIGNQRSMVWVDPELNIVTNFHRMGGDLDVGGYSGDLGYDISLDGGNTWTTMVECYVAVDNNGGTYYTDAARYPSHGIYNPTNNIDDAYIAFYAPNLDASNSDTPDSGWGGHARGTSKISDPSITTRHLITSENGTFLYIPEAYDITNEGLSISVDNNVDWTSGSGVYEGNLTLNKGVWNSDQNDFIYTTSELEFDVESPWYTQVAFAPDGMTGYIVSLGNDGTTWSVEGNPNIYPIIFKTTDGGQTWGDPQPIQMDGPNGIGGVVYHLLTDQDLENLYEPPIPAREDIPYTFTGDMDIVVTADGNLHIAGLVGVAGEAETGISFYVTNGFGRIIDLFTKDGGETWEIETMGKIATYDYQWNGDGVHEANRTQITTNPDRDMIFVSWLDTDIEEAVDNDSPNIWCRGFDPSSYLKTNNGSGEDAPTNVTIFSEGMWSAYFATAPKIGFESENGVFTIPYVYVDWDTSNDAAPVQYKYISNFSFSMADFTVQGIDKPNEVENNNSVSQNFPNPFKSESYVTLNLNEGTDVSLEVYSLTGQKVSEKTYGYLTNGSHTLTIKGNDLTPGVYFYTVTAGENKYTHKMIIK